jgi:hypothetical protein
MKLTPLAAQGRDSEERTAAYRSLFRPQLDAEAAIDIRQALQLGVPVGNDRYAEVICARAGVRRNSCKRGRPGGEMVDGSSRLDGQEDFGF